VIFTRDPNRTTKIRCVDRSGAPYFLATEINSDRFVATIARRHRRAQLTGINPNALMRLKAVVAPASMQKQNPAGSEPTGFSRKDDRRRVLARWPVKDLLCD
jgi:hypothetical protein